MTLKELRVKRSGRRTRALTLRQWMDRQMRIKARREKREARG